jgi:tyrosinase
MATVRVRKDAWKLATWDPDILWYAKAIAKMQTRPIKEPKSWRYQAAMHEYVVGEDPLPVKPGDLPSAADQKRFWTQCQHGSWFFLSWHRMYLFHFEQIVADTIVQLGGPADWALPYWNYSDSKNANATKLPPAFSHATMPDGSPNPLRVADRSRGNDGGVVAKPKDVNIRTCLSDTKYESAPGTNGFGGPKTVFEHQGGTIGKLEQTPHGSIHNAVGGWMSQFNTAALDPIFWLHHANIDRLWSVWRARDSRDLNPTDPAWLTKVSFEFHDAGGNVVSHTSSQVVDTTAAPLFYKYEDESDPLHAAPARGPAAVLTKAGVMPEMVGATSAPVLLTEQLASAQFSVKPPSGPALAARAPGARPAGVHLNLENITGSQRRPVAYSVYVNLPPGSDPESHPELYAGELPMFGLAEASRADTNHAGNGLHYTLDLTELIPALDAQGDWSANDIRVTFVPDIPPTRPQAPLQAQPAEAIKIGRVSLYYS